MREADVPAENSYAREWEKAAPHSIFARLDCSMLRRRGLTTRPHQDAENLDSQLEPIAEALILIIFLIAIAAVAFFLINKIALRRKQQAHNKLSTSRRSKHNWVDLSAGREGSREGDSAHRSTRRRRRPSSSNHVMLDILAKPKEAKSDTSSPDDAPSA